MNYFLTGETGLLAGRLVQQLVARQGHIYVLFREPSRRNIDALCASLPAGTSARIIPVYGEITEPRMGLSANNLGVLRGNVSQFFHLATVDDSCPEEAGQDARSITGTTNAVLAAQFMNAACFHHISCVGRDLSSSEKIAKQFFAEVDCFDRWSFSAHNASEIAVLRHCTIPYRLYRPAAPRGCAIGGKAAELGGTRYRCNTLH